MLRNRIIFSLVYADGDFNQSRNFRLQKVGNLSWLNQNYKFSKIANSIDELIVLDASRKNRSIDSFSEVIEKLVNNVFVPICAGGGVRSLEDVDRLFNSGADKIILNSILYENPKLVVELVKIYGSQSIVASIDYKNNEGVNEVYIENGSTKINFEFLKYINYVQSLNIGEIYLNSIEKDGTGFGYDFETIEAITNGITVPLIIAGGAGNEKHFIEGLNISGVSAVATANLFNFIGDGLPNARENMLRNNVNIVKWKN